MNSINCLPTEFQSAGTIESVQGAVLAQVNAAVGEKVVVWHKDGTRSEGEVIGFDQSNVQLMLMNSEPNLSRGDRVIATGKKPRVPVGSNLLGRVLNSAGFPIDGQPLRLTAKREIEFLTPNPLTREPIQSPIESGVRAIDGLLTIGMGQRVGLFAGSGVGKSTLLSDIARNALTDVNIIALIGERGREVRPFINEVLGSEGGRKSVVIVSTSDQSPLARVRAAEYAVFLSTVYRKEGKNVLLLLDSLTRIAMAQRELGLMLGEPPASRGYTPSVFQKMSGLLEQLGNDENGSVTGIVTVLVDGDDFNDPVSDAARSILDGHIVLSRNLAERNHFPAIDVLKSASRVAHSVISPEHIHLASAIKRKIAEFNEINDLVEMGLYQRGSVESTDRLLDLMPSINGFLRQNMGESSSLQQTLSAMKNISLMFGGN